MRSRPGVGGVSEGSGRQGARRDRGGVGAAVAAPRNIMVEVFYFKAWLQFLVSAFAMQQLDLDTRSPRDNPHEVNVKYSPCCWPKPSVLVSWLLFESCRGLQAAPN